MKKQETVEKNFQKVIDQWEESRDRKIRNIQRAQQELVVKSKKLQAEYSRLENEILRLQQMKGPQAPSQQKRIEAHNKVGQLHLDAE